MLNASVVADIGCGGGELVRLVRQTNPRAVVVGLDMTMAPLRAAADDQGRDGQLPGTDDGRRATHWTTVGRTRRWGYGSTYELDHDLTNGLTAGWNLTHAMSRLHIGA